MKNVLLTLCAFFLSAFAAHADAGGPVYNISGTLTIPGTTGSEVIGFSFQAQYVYSTTTGSGDGWYIDILPGGTATGSDPALGAITMGGPGLAQSPQYHDPTPPNGDANSNLYVLSDAGGDVVDLYFQNNGYPTDPTAPALAGGYIWSCITSACDNNYCDQTSNFCLDNGSRWFGVSTGGVLVETTTVVSTPEPRTTMLLLAGLGLIVLVRVQSARRVRPQNC